MKIEIDEEMVARLVAEELADGIHMSVRNAVRTAVLEALAGEEEALRNAADTALTALVAELRYKIKYEGFGE